MSPSVAAVIAAVSIDSASVVATDAISVATKDGFGDSGFAEAMILATTVAIFVACLATVFAKTVASCAIVATEANAIAADISG